MTATPQAPASRLVLGRYRGLVAQEVECDFVHGGMATPDGGFWRYREPDATVVVEHDRLRVAVRRLTRSHDSVQFFDNAKHMYCSRRRVAVPESGVVAVEVGLTALVTRGRDDDLYSGFVSMNVLDLEHGLAFDWFLSNRRAATVYARLPFAGVGPVETGDADDRPRWFCLFDEVRTDLAPGVEHRCRIEYSRAGDRVRYLFDGDELGAYAGVPVRASSLQVALGIMTEKPIGAAGSVSCFGQGVTATYSEVAVEGSPGLI